LVLFTLINVWLLTRERILAWPFGLLGVGLYVYIFYSVRLYSDFILHIIYVILNIYGWVYWARKGPVTANRLPVTVLSGSAGISWLLMILVTFIIWGYAVDYTTDASFVYPDAFTTVASLVAQFLLARKKLENWILWILVDIVAINIYLRKDLELTAGLYTILLILSIIGLLRWFKSYNEDRVFEEG
jgi:nicotinamide mononucleotide transporter